MKLSNLLSAMVAAAATASALSIDFPDKQSLLSGPNPLGKHVPGDSPIFFCSPTTPNDDFVTIETIDISPNPPAPGKTLTITATGIIKKRIEEGAYIDVEVKLGYIRLVKKTFDFCEKIEEADVGVACPVEPGPLKITKDADIPNEIPPGKFVVTASLFTKDDELITCLHAEVQFKRS